MVEPLTIDRAGTALSREPSPPGGRRAIPRTELLERLESALDVPVVVIVAPTGYGKTTLLSQWAERDPRRAEWIRATEPHPVATAADTAAGEAGRLVLLDDVHALRNRHEVAELGRMLDRVAPGTTVALVGRAEPRLPLARLRAAGRLLELGPGDLALTTTETRALLRSAGVLLPEREADELRRHTEGWPAVTFLAALALRAGSTSTTHVADDRFITDYIRSEHLARLSPRLRRFVTSSSVLDPLSVEACDAVLERDDSARVLDELERGCFVVALDRGRRLYRYPAAVRGVLRAELDLDDPALARRLHGRASEWNELQGATEQALDHAAAAGNLDRIATLAERDALNAFATSRLESLERGLALLRDRPSAERHGELCVIGALTHAVRGRPDEAQHWCDSAERALPHDDSRLLLLRALRCRDGIHQMLDDAAACTRGRPRGDLWRPAALLTAGVAHFLVGDATRAEPELSEAFELASAADATTIRTLSFCLRALLPRGDDTAAEPEILLETTPAAGTPATSSAVDALAHALSARAALRRGDREQALREAARAERLRPYLTYALPWLSVLVLLQLTHVRLGLADAAGARDLVRGVEDLLRIRPRLGTLVEEAAELRRRTRALSDPNGRWASSLTSAEARLLPLLATHLSFREIGDLLFVSRNTVKTQAISVYRKFGVSSRSEAVARALDLGLIDEKAAVSNRPAADAR
jgi:LuxR family transcriptional regulator, maltose regulon positive regulatory protein